ncbi:MAG: hypothetical protein QOH91_2650 [Mycobacterium sp.]|jgi:hypothetical protein|nr:hypothetical protein [Mycobacterium sp.]
MTTTAVPADTEPVTGLAAIACTPAAALSGCIPRAA